jgi:hypothetical protein
MRYVLTLALLPALAAGTAGCSSGQSDQPYTAIHPADPPPLYSDEINGRPIALPHPFRCTSCGWYWR